MNLCELMKDDVFFEDRRYYVALANARRYDFGWEVSCASFDNGEAGPPLLMFEADGHEGGLGLILIERNGLKEKQ